MAANTGPVFNGTSRTQVRGLTIAQMITRRDALKAEKAVRIKEGCKLCTINQYNHKIAMVDGEIRRAEREAAKAAKG